MLAENELVERYSRGVRLVLLKRTGNEHLANDLCQDTFMLVLRKLRAGELKNRNSLSAFVRQIAVNLSIDHYRKEKRYIHQSDGIFSLQLSHKDNQSRKLDDETVRMAIENALKELAVPRDREILRRFYLSDEDKDQICRDFGLTSEHFDRVLYRARKRMREMINKHPRLKELLIGGIFDA